MRTISAVAMITFCAATVGNYAADEPPSDSSNALTDAVTAFNEKAKQDPIGNDQPALTEDEVVAAIRGWIRQQIPASDEVFDAFQEIAETRQLPEHAKLTYTTSWLGYRGFHFDVWWVDLFISTGEKTGYTFRIRDRKIRSRAITELAPPLMTEEESLESHLLTDPPMQFVSKLTRDELIQTPPWEQGSEYPPLSPRKAEALALSMLDKIMGQRSWGSPVVSMRAFDVTQGKSKDRAVRWIYVLQFRLLSPKANEGGSIHIIVLMNGKAVEPRRAN